MITNRKNFGLLSLQVQQQEVVRHLTQQKQSAHVQRPLDHSFLLSLELLMAKNLDHTTLLCLFHHTDQANAALDDLASVRIPRDLISVLGGDSDRDEDASTLLGLGVPKRDLQHLQDGLAEGGLIVLVKALTDHVDDVEAIFSKHRAEKIDEAETSAPVPEPLSSSEPMYTPTPAADYSGAATILPATLAVPVLGEAYDAGLPSTSQTSTFSGEDEATSLPPSDTLLLVSESEVSNGEADLALQALSEETLAPIEVIVVPDAAPREPIRPMQPYSQYRQVD